MEKEPDIIKELKEAEKLGLLQNMNSCIIKELESLDESTEKTSDQTNNIIKYLEKGINNNEFVTTEEKYQTIFENYAIALTIADNKERILSWNKYTEKLLNLTQDDLYLKPVSSLYPPEEWQKIRREDVRKKGIKYSIESRMIKKNKGFVDVELTLCVLKGKDGKIAGSIGIIKDITKQKDFERELKNSKERYKTIFENSAVAITLTDENERIISWNKCTEHLLGVHKKDLYLKPVEELYPIGEWQKIRSKNIRKKGLHHHLETKMIKKNNDVIDVNLSLSVLKNHDEKIVGSIGVITDITEQKKQQELLQKSEDKFRNLAEKSPNMIFLFNKGGVLFANKRCEELIGFTRKEFYSPNFDFLTIIAPESKELIKTSFKKHMNGDEINPYEYTLLTKDGKKIEALITTKLLKSEDDFVILGIVTDISKQKKIEKELKNSYSKIAKLNQELEGKIEMRTAEVQKLLKQKNELIHQLGHDLKNPLTPLIALLPLLEKTEENPQTKKVFELLRRNIYNLKNIVYRILELAEYNSHDSNMLNEENLNLREIAKRCIIDQQPICKNKNFQVDNNINEDIFINGDKVQLHELFNNLIVNAVKYSPLDSNIIIDANVDRDIVTVSIMDNGNGMTEEQLEHVFDEFYKADESRHDLNSSGLGLSICKRIVDKHGGRIWAESSGIGTGSTFYFTLPIGKKIIKMEDI